MSIGKYLKHAVALKVRAKKLFIIIYFYFGEIQDAYLLGNVFFVYTNNYERPTLQSPS